MININEYLNNLYTNDLYKSFGFKPEMLVMRQ